MRSFILIAALCCCVSCATTALGEADVVVVEEAMVHLRSGDEREWSTFRENAKGSILERQFQSVANPSTWTLSLRQQDVKQSWDVRINDKSLGRLVRDEMDLHTDFAVPKDVLVDGENRLEIRQAGRPDNDDIRVGQIRLHKLAPPQRRGGAAIEVVLTDPSDQPLPGRITIVDQQGTLVPVIAEKEKQLAVREGVVYTATGNAELGVAPGVYRIFGSRGFEYSVGTTRVRIGKGERAKRTIRLSREVDTTGWVACDTHVHTVTHSGHGDCTVEERMVTLAAEGVEFPIATDHNKQIDYAPIAASVGVESYFTPVVGNEVTTKEGHFNIFPAMPDGPTPDHTQTQWGKLFDDIFSSSKVRVAILNHGRDIHSGFRPFSPRHHLSLTGENLDGRPQRFNAMELINSGAVQTDPMELFADWCGLINRGLVVTPVGSSDSHDVSRYIVGQGRTYIQCEDSEADQIDVDKAITAFLDGRVVVSYGLLTKLIVNGQHGPGDTVRIDDNDAVELTIEVHGPSWARADAVHLFVNGRSRFSKQLPRNARAAAGLKASVTWRVPRSDFTHDVWVTAVATGPGTDAPFWKSAKPYQPDSIEFSPYSFSVTGPVRIDVDRDGEFHSPRDYAEQIFAGAGNDANELAARLKGVHPSVTHQAMELCRDASINLDEIKQATSDDVRAAIVDYERAWQATVRARLESAE